MRVSSQTGGLNLGSAVPVSGACSIRGDVEDPLTGLGRQRQRQRRSAGDHVHRPLDPIGKGANVIDQSPQCRLVVVDTPREQAGAVAVDHDRMMMVFTDVDSNPDALQTALPWSS